MKKDKTLFKLNNKKSKHFSVLLILELTFKQINQLDFNQVKIAIEMTVLIKQMKMKMKMSIEHRLRFKLLNGIRYL